MAVGKKSLLRAASAAEQSKKPEKSWEVGCSMSIRVIPAERLRMIPDDWCGGSNHPNVSLLAESVSRVGILEPLPVVQTGEEVYQAVGGRQRLEVIRMLGIQEVPVYVLPGESEEDAWRLYRELAPFASSFADQKKENKKSTESRPGLFGRQRIPEYLL